MSNMASIKELKSIVGEDAFQELVKQLPGRNVYIPKNYNEKFHDIKKRNKQITQDYHDGMEIHELMVKYKLSRATIYKITEKK